MCMDITLGHDDNIIRFWLPFLYFKVTAELNRSNLRALQT